MPIRVITLSGESRITSASREAPAPAPGDTPPDSVCCLADPQQFTDVRSSIHAAQIQAYPARILPGDDTMEHDQAGRPRAPLHAATDSRTLVGIGASAGGLDAIKELLDGLPAETGLSFVVVMHLSPSHDSNLAEILQHHTRLRVTTLTGRVELQPDTVYVIPPNANIDSISADHIRLSDLEPTGEGRAPIDHFFRTMARAHRASAIGVVLSGTGSDGTLGMRRIREAGGLTIAQAPDQAQYSGMPRSAIESGAVDLELPIGDMPEQILKLAKPAPPVLPTTGGDEADLGSRGDSGAFERILSAVRARTGHDFSQYKRSTVARRIGRRMQVHGVAGLGEYLRILRDREDEADQLLRDLLITVTQFFRDPDSFEHLEENVIPSLFERTQTGESVRAWSVGCATGEEAYTLAMLLWEEADRRDRRADFQIFATDLHEGSLASARLGLYPGGIGADVPNHLLTRFFSPEGSDYRIRRDLRERVTFARNNALSDPPFSRLNIVLCRNLMIYLQRDAQHSLLAMLHYALRPGGYLMLGRSETIDQTDLFARVSGTHSIYSALDVPTPRIRMPGFASATHGGNDEEQIQRPPQQSTGYGQRHAQMAEMYGPPSVLTGNDREILHTSAEAGRFLRVPGGTPTRDVLKLVREPLVHAVRESLALAEQTGRMARSGPVNMDLEGEHRRVVVRVRRGVNDDHGSHFLVMFDELETAEEGGTGSATGGSMSTDGATADELRHELEQTKRRLAARDEQFDISQEKMQAANEELQSSNEELRSTLEELETSKEELQSTNEELTTLNHENSLRIDRLSRLTETLENLIASTEIATIFLDRELHIVWSTPRAQEVLNIRGTDRGRPLKELTSRLIDLDLEKIARDVQRTGSDVEHEVPTDDGSWHIARIKPYRTSQGTGEGVVIALIDITERVTAERELREAKNNLEHRIAERTSELEALTRRLRLLGNEVAAAEHRERKRLASLLHDDLQQHLVAAKLRLRPPSSSSESRLPTHEKRLEHAAALIDDALAASRNLTHQLRPPVLYEDGLIPALRWLAREMSERHEFSIEVSTDREHVPLHEDLSAMLYASTRELAFNAVKHAETREAWIRIESSPTHIRIRVADGGKGFDPASLDIHDPEGSGLGLFGLRERLRSHGGSLEIDAAPRAGTRVTMELPIEGGSATRVNVAPRLPETEPPARASDDAT